MPGRTVLLEETSQIRAANFFFAFHQKDQVDRQIAPFPQGRFNAKNVRQNLTFVVGRSTGKDFAISYHRLERRCLPKVQRIGGVKVVGAIDQDRPSSWLVL